MMLLDFFTTWGLYCYNTLPAFRSLDERFAVDHFSELDRQMTSQFGLPYPTDREREARLEMLRVHLIRNAAWCAFFVVQPDDPDSRSGATPCAAPRSSSRRARRGRRPPPPRPPRRRRAASCPASALRRAPLASDAALPASRPRQVPRDHPLGLLLSCLIRHVHVHDAIALTIAHAVGIEHDAGTKQWSRDPMSDDANASCGERFCGATNYYAVAPPRRACSPTPCPPTHSWARRASCARSSRSACRSRADAGWCCTRRPRPTRSPA